MSSQSVEELSFTIFGFISRSTEQVYEAVADPRQLSRYFTTGGAQGRLETGATVTWDFADFPGSFPVKVISAEQSRHITLGWGGIDTVGDTNSTTVTFTFEAVDDYTRTKVTITESAWLPTAEGVQDAFNNSMGWTGMLSAMKAWLEHGINLREGFYK